MLDDVRSAAPDLYLSLLLTEGAARPALLALYALESELLQIPARVTQPTLGILRVTWWHDQLQKRDTSTPLLKELAAHWPNDAAVLADFADSYSVMFDELTHDAAEKVIAARAMLWATLVARQLNAPMPDAYAAAAAHYGLAGQGKEPNAKPLKIITRLAARRSANRNGWLGDVWTAVRTAVY